MSVLHWQLPVQAPCSRPWQLLTLLLLSQVSEAPHSPLQAGSQTHHPRLGADTSPVGQGPPQVGSGSHRPLGTQPTPVAVFQVQPGRWPQTNGVAALPQVLPMPPAKVPE